jgi:phage/plasmid primase-like uncharacterized protein
MKRNIHFILAKKNERRIEMDQTEAILKIVALKNCFKELEEINKRGRYEHIENAKELIASKIHEMAKNINTPDKEFREVKMEEWEAEVFVEKSKEGNQSLIIIDKKKGNVFYLSIGNFAGKISDERRKKLKSIRIFDIE